MPLFYALTQGNHYGILRKSAARAQIGDAQPALLIDAECAPKLVFVRFEADQRGIIQIERLNCCATTLWVVPEINRELYDACALVF